MKTNLHCQGWVMNLMRLGLVGGLSLLMGCASTSTKQTAGSKVPPLPAGVTLHQDKDIQGVWLAEGFNFKGYDTLYIAVPVFAAIERDNEVEMRAMALRVLPEQLSNCLSGTKLFTTVTTLAEDVKPGAKNLKMENTIIEYEQGGRAARSFAGLFGGGQPVIKVRGQIMDGVKLVCVFEVKRSGESGGARVAGEFMSNEEIQREDIRDLATDLADFIRRTANVQ